MISPERPDDPAENKKSNMKIKHIITGVGVLSIAMGVTVSVLADEDKDDDGGAKQAKLMAEATVSKEDAQATALAKVPNGTVKETEIEKEKGKLIWSFDITTPDSTDTTEVNVNAKTGKLVSMEWESAADEAKEDNDKKGDKENNDDKD